MADGRRAVEESLARLRGRGLLIGDKDTRPLSYLAHLRDRLGDAAGTIQFERFVWDKAIVLGGIVPLHLVAFEDDEAPDALSPQTLRNLDKLTNLCDLYGWWPELLRREPMPASTRDAFRAWAGANLSVDLVQAIGEREVVDQLALAVRQQISRYRFDRDLLDSWLGPVLVTTACGLFDAIRPGIAAAENVIHLNAENILGMLYARFGVYGLRSDEVAERTVLVGLQASNLQFTAAVQRHGTAALWLLAVLKKHIEGCVQFHCIPVDEMQWGIDERADTCELKKRVIFLQALAAAAQGVGGVRRAPVHGPDGGPPGPADQQPNATPGSHTVGG